VPIRFFSEGIDFKIPRPIATKRWLNTVLKSEGKSLHQLNYVFCNDEFLLGINQQYLNHKTLTDIITFDMSTSKNEVVGEIYISVPRVVENSVAFNKTFENELCRVLVHGVLHLCGYKDKTAYQIRQMRKREDAYLSLLANH